VSATAHGGAGASPAGPARVHTPELYVGKHLAQSHVVTRLDLQPLAAELRICARWASDATPEWSDEVERIAMRVAELAKSLEDRAREHLYSTLHGFLGWPDDEFQAAISRKGSAVACHEQDHTAFPDDWNDVNDELGLAEHAHEHKPGDPLRTWGADRD
jgi:hypothetical protein